MSDPKKEKPKTLQEIMDKAGADHEKIMRYIDEQKQTDPNKYDPEKDMIYHAHIDKVAKIPCQVARYKAIAMGDPAKMPEDIELYIELELERISKESLV